MSTINPPTKEVLAAYRKGPAYQSFNHGRVYNVAGRGNVTAATLFRERRDAATLERNQALVGKVIAGCEGGRYWIGTVAKAYKNLTLLVVTRGGNRVTTQGGEEYTFERWDAAVNDPENNLTQDMIIS